MSPIFIAVDPAIGAVTAGQAPEGDGDGDGAGATQLYAVLAAVRPPIDTPHALPDQVQSLAALHAVESVMAGHFAELYPFALPQVVYE